MPTRPDSESDANLRNTVNIYSSWPYILAALILGALLLLWGQDCNRTRDFAHAAVSHKELDQVIADQKKVDDDQNDSTGREIGAAETRLNGRIDNVVADQKKTDDGQNGRLTAAEQRIESSRRLTVNLRHVRGSRPVAATQP